MKKHNTLKELLFEYTQTIYDAMRSSPITVENLMDEFLLNNSLALGKQKPLAKNKQFIKSCKNNKAHDWYVAGHMKELHKCYECGEEKIV